MSFTSVRSTLVTAYKAGNFFTDANTQWENMPFVAPDNAWAAVNFVQNQPVVATLGQGGEDNVDGFMQIDLNYPLQSGEKKVSAKFEDIRNAFTAGTKLIYQGQAVAIKSCGRSQGRVVNGYYKVSVTIMFYAHINR